MFNYWERNVKYMYVNKPGDGKEFILSTILMVFFWVKPVKLSIPSIQLNFRSEQDKKLHWLRPVVELAQCVWVPKLPQPDRESACTRSSLNSPVQMRALGGPTQEAEAMRWFRNFEDQWRKPGGTGGRETVASGSSGWTDGNIVRARTAWPTDDGVGAGQGTWV